MWCFTLSINVANESESRMNNSRPRMFARKIEERDIGFVPLA
jgi:hypothetical protein